MRAALGALVLVVGLMAPTAAASPDIASTAAGEASLAQPADPAVVGRAPALRVRRLVRGLAQPWDVQPIGGGRLLITERNSGRLLRWRKGVTRRVAFPSHRIWVSGETGLQSLAIDPQFARTRRFYTCSGWRKANDRHDIRVVAWRLDRRATRARLVRTLVSGLPTSTGRHAGCRLLITRNGSLLVGTGDAAQGRNPRNLRSLGGKTLRLNRFTGAPWPDNPWPHAAHRNRRYVLTFGHRNVQGLAQRADGSLWSVEHGPHRDDEVNRLRPRGDYGWHPVPGYNESVPMTDQSLPGPQVGARWRSGAPTLATSGATWVRGRQWGGLRGTLAVAALKGSRVVFMKFDAAGRFRWSVSPRILRGFGRLRSVTNAPDGDLLITTANGRDDMVLRVAPR